VKSQELEQFTFGRGYNGSRQRGLLEPEYMAAGSYNILCEAEGTLRPFNGFTDVGAGQRVSFPHPFGYCGLADYSGNTAGGSVSVIYGHTLAYIGVGELYVNGATTSKTASNLLQLLPYSSGSYGGTAYIAGLARPSAAAVALVDASGGLLGLLEDGAYSIQISRVRSTTGGRSVASPTSEIVVAAVRKSCASASPRRRAVKLIGRSTARRKVSEAPAFTCSCARSRSPSSRP
jgi:hypothetical protein